MTIVEFYRYVPTLDVVKLKKDHQIYNVFTINFDHEVHNSDDQFPLNRAINVVKIWLENHYGFCKIYTNGIDEFTQDKCIILSNRKKFIKDMEGFSVKATIKRANHD